MQTIWKSYHVFMWNYEVFDDFIRAFYKLLTKQQKENIFFIRYWKGGPNLRIRIKKENSEIVRSLIEDALQVISEQYPGLNNITLNKNDFYETTFMDGESFDLKNLPRFKNLSIVEIPYVREVERYGGTDLMAQTERIFCMSSIIVSHLIKRPLLLSQKIVILYRTVELVVENILTSQNDKIRYYSMSSRFWKSLERVESIDIETSEKIYQISHNLNLLSLLSEFISGLKAIYLEVLKQDQEYAMSVVMSHLHMFANRLGVSIDTELSCYNYFREKERYDAVG
mgnify:CR=1 FL=1